MNYFLMEALDNLQTEAGREAALSLATDIVSKLMENNYEEPIKAWNKALPAGVNISKPEYAKLTNWRTNFTDLILYFGGDLSVGFAGSAIFSLAQLTKTQFKAEVRELFTSESALGLPLLTVEDEDGTETFLVFTKDGIYNQSEDSILDWDKLREKVSSLLAKNDNLTIGNAIVEIYNK